MNKAQVLTHIKRIGLVPVLRARSASDAIAIAEAIIAGGVDVLEVTMTVPGALHVIRELTARHPDALIGAGSVLDSETARLCIVDGARFVVSPVTSAAMITMCHRHGVVAMPGALTPTEILSAVEQGADIVKVFPANAMGGAAYLRSLRAPMPHLQMIPTGGVSLTTAKDFLAAGAVALGVGADLVDPDAVREARLDAVTAKTREYVAEVQRARSTV